MATHHPRRTTHHTAQAEPSAETIQQIQEALGVEATGRIDRQTTDALRIFQKDNHLPANGRLTRDTMSELLGSQAIDAQYNRQLQPQTASAAQPAKSTAPATAALTAEWKPLLEQGKEGHMFMVETKDGKKEPVMVNAKGELRVPPAYKQTAPNEEMILRAVMQNAADHNMVPNYKPGILRNENDRGVLPAPGSFPPATPLSGQEFIAMVPDFALNRRDNAALKTPIEPNGHAAVRLSADPAQNRVTRGGQQEVGPFAYSAAVDVRAAIKLAVGDDGVISRTEDAKAQALGTKLQSTGIVFSNGENKSALGELAAVGVRMQATAPMARGGGDGGGNGGGPGGGSSGGGGPGR